MRCNREVEGCNCAEGGPPVHREAKLHLTHRMLSKVLALCRHELRKQQRAAVRNARIGWKPKPGQTDVTENISHMMRDIINQGAPQLGLTAEEWMAHKENGNGEAERAA